MNQNLDQILLQAQNNNNQIRGNAEKVIIDSASKDYLNFLLVCSEYIADEGNNTGSRQLCGTVISNLISGGFIAFRGKWISLDFDYRKKIKDLILPVLGSNEKKVRNQVSTCIASICAQEFPKGEWFEILSILEAASTNEDLNYRCSSLNTLKNIMQDVPPGVMNAESIAIVLFTILKNIRKEDPPEVRIESLKALNYSIVSARAIFEFPEQRKILVNLIFSSLNFPELDQQVLGIKCIVESVKNFYSEMSEYIDEILDISNRIVTENKIQKSVMIYEIWSTIADEEINRIQNCYEHKGYIQSRELDLLKLCMYSLNTRSDEEEEDEWLPYKAATMTMRGISQCCTIVYMQTVMEQVGNFLNSTNPKQRDSAMLMFGSLIVTIHEDYIRQIIIDGLENILNKLEDTSIEVRKNTGYVIEKICEHYFKYFDSKNFDLIMKTLYKNIESQENKKVICYMLNSIHQIALNCSPNREISNIQ